MGMGKTFMKKIQLAATFILSVSFVFLSLPLREGGSASLSSGRRLHQDRWGGRLDKDLGDKPVLAGAVNFEEGNSQNFNVLPAGKFSSFLTLFDFFPIHQITETQRQVAGMDQSPRSPPFSFPRQSP
jgi:hypothetical protein